jgi:hypothetical protein
MMIRAVTRTGADLRAWRPASPAARNPFHPHESDRRRKFRQELARRWDLLQLEEARKSTGRCS